MADAPPRYQQTTKSREAYKNLQVTFTRSPSSSKCPRHRPLSTGGGSSLSRDQVAKKNNVTPSPWPSYATHDAVGVRRKRASFDHPVGQPFNPPPLFARRLDGDRESTGTKIGPRVVGRLVKSRTRVRPSSANARADGKPGEGYGNRRIEQGTGSVILRKVPVPSQAVANLRRVKHASKSSIEQQTPEVPTLSDNKDAVQASLGKTSRPKSAAIRRTCLKYSSNLQTCPNVDGSWRNVENAAALSYGHGKKFAGATGVTIFSSGERCGSPAREQRRPRPKSAVARVETTFYHGKGQVGSTTADMAPCVPARLSTTVSAKERALKAAVAFKVRVHSKSSCSQSCIGKIGMAHGAARPQSAATRRSNIKGSRGQQESVQHVMGKIFGQRRTCVGEEVSSRKDVGGGTEKGKPDARQYRRPQSAHIHCSNSIAAAAVTAISMATTAAAQTPPVQHMWGLTPSAKSSHGEAAGVAAAVEASDATGIIGITGRGQTRCVKAKPGEKRECEQTNNSRFGTNCLLFRMKYPGWHRRVGVDPLEAFKKGNCRSTPVGSRGPTPGAVAATPVLTMAVGQCRNARDESIAVENIGGDPKQGNARGEVYPVETQATLSTANTGSLTPPGGSSSVEAQVVGEVVRVTPTLEPLTKASAEFCNHQERHYLCRLMLDLQGSARSSLDFYRLGKVIGEGSFAKVRVAWHKLTGQRVAVKTYEKAKMKKGGQWKRISQEVQLMERLNHPRVVRFFETAESSKWFHLVIEHADGGNLCSYVKRRKRLHESEARRIFFQLLEGVDYLHSLDIVHRDIKLENVLLESCRGVSAKLVDFGFSANVKNHRLLHVFCGTPSYMAPEIIKRQEYKGKPVDIWSLGVVLYAMLCGCFPFSGPSYPELYRNISKGVFRVPDSLLSSPASLVHGMLTADPTRRLTLRQVISHPWLVSSRAASTAWSGKHHRPTSARAIRRPPSPTYAFGGLPGSRLQSFHISSDPSSDICAESVKRMMTFGADGGEITRQVLAQRHSCLTTTFYLLKQDLRNRKQIDRSSTMLDSRCGEAGCGDNISDCGFNRSTGDGYKCRINIRSTKQRALAA